MAKKIPTPRNSPSKMVGCVHATTKKKGPFKVPMPKGEIQYYQIWCTSKCKQWIANEDMNGKRL